MSTRNGFYKGDPLTWREIVPRLTGTWPESFVIQDLIYFDNESRRKDGEPLPGRPTLMRRWGWTDWEVRKILRRESEWKSGPTDEQASTSQTPAPASDTPVRKRSNADKRPGSTSRHQRSTSAPPSRDLFPEEDQEEKKTPPKPPMGAVAVVFDRWVELWKKYHPDSTRSGWTSAEEATIRARLKEPGVTVEDMLAVVDWAEFADDDWAPCIRGERAWSEDRPPKVYIGPETLFKPKAWAGRLERARRHQRGLAGPGHADDRKILMTPAEVADAMANGLGEFMAELYRRHNGMRLLMERDWKARVGGPLGAFDPIYNAWTPPND